MRKKKISITLDDNLVKDLKKHGGNLSARIEQFVRRGMASNQQLPKETDEEVVALEEAVKDLMNELATVNRRLATIEKTISESNR